MHWPRAAGRQQRVFGRNAATLGDGDACRARHILVDDIVDAERGAARLDAQGRRQLAERAIGRRAIDLHGAAQEEVGVEVTQGEICLLYTSPSPRDGLLSRMPSSA